jgi:hypothetical protein
MKLFKTRNGCKLKPTWAYTPGGTIWRVISAKGKIVGEERDLEKKKAAYFCINQMTGEILWESVSLEEPWWIGIEAIHRDVLFLHKFTTPDLPEHRSVLAIDILSGSVLWSNDEIAFMKASGDSMFGSVHSLEGRQVLELDYRNGAILRAWGNNEQVVIDAVEETADINGFELPRLVFDLEADGTPIENVLKNNLGNISIAGPVEVIESGDALIFGYHERVGADVYANRLNVLDLKSSEIVFHETLHANTGSVVPESFFVAGNSLLYIKERKTLTAIHLQ